MQGQRWEAIAVVQAGVNKGLTEDSHWRWREIVLVTGLQSVRESTVRDHSQGLGQSGVDGAHVPEIGRQAWRGGESMRSCFAMLHFDVTLSVSHMCESGPGRERETEIYIWASYVIQGLD